MAQEDQQPAFPVIAENGLGHVAPGMSLRDWFAGQALSGICSNDHALNAYVPALCAEWAYQFADAMLVQRQKGGA